MKVTVVGLGAVGGLIAARLAETAAAPGGPAIELSGIARGATLQAVRRDGLAVERGGERRRVALAATDDPATLPVQDLVVIALKAPALAAMAERLASLLGPDTRVLPAMNGVPWWFMPAVDPAAAPLASVDPDGALLRALPLARVLGCVVHLSASCPEPGVVRHSFGERLIVGEPAGGDSARTQAVCALLARAGFQAEPSADIRREVWYKLWGNLTMNPVSALTGATADRILDDPLVFAWMVRTMGEAAAVGARIGCRIDQSGAERMQLARQLGAFRTSMLQDTEAGRPIELDALVTAVQEIGARMGVETPNIDALLGLTRLMARQRGLY